MRRVVIAAILVVAIGAPIMELFDRWDPAIEQGGGDTEGNAVIVALCVGVAFAVGATIVTRMRAPRVTTARAANVRPRHASEVSLRPVSEPRGRAPTPLRV